MKRLFKASLPLFLGVLVLVISDKLSAQMPAQGGVPEGGNAIISTQTTGGSGGILAPPGGGVLDGVYTPEHLNNRKPIPYVYEREADIMWQRRIWRIIDLREKINHPLYYPTEDLAKRPSLWRVLQNGIYNGKITTVFQFDPFTFEFGPLMQLPEIAMSMTESLIMRDSIGDILYDSIGNAMTMPDTLKPDRIMQYYLKEDWFFEKQRSVMDVRIIAIAPIIESIDFESDKFSYKPLFWLYYPAIRNYLSQFYCYNPYNDAEWRTFDEIFHKRLFASYTTMESNVYNRPIAAYMSGQGMEQLLESERIKDDIFKYEHDMWNY